jgi:hypothetical protein
LFSWRYLATKSLTESSIKPTDSRSQIDINEDYSGWYSNCLAVAVILFGIYFPNLITNSLCHSVRTFETAKLGEKIDPIAQC